MASSMTVPEGVGHQYTPPLQADVTPTDTKPSTVDSVAPEYGQLCVTAANEALSARAIDNDRAASVPNAYSR